jgi:tetratricopeptide (TPR) repeat protein
MRRFWLTHNSASILRRAYGGGTRVLSKVRNVLLYIFLVTSLSCGSQQYVDPYFDQILSKVQPKEFTDDRDFVEKKIKDLIKKDPLPYHILLGQYYNAAASVSGRPAYKEAIKEFQSIIKIDPNVPDAYFGISKVCYNVAIDYARQCNASDGLNNVEDIKKIIYALQRSLEEIEEGLKLLKAGEQVSYYRPSQIITFKDEIQVIIKWLKQGKKEVLRLRSEAATQHYFLGRGLVESDTRLAIKEFKDAINICPEFAEAYIDLGNVYHMNGQINDAIVLFCQAILIMEKDVENGVPKEILKSTFAIAHFNLGNAYKDITQFDLARKEWEKVLLIAPHHDGAKNNLEILKQIHPYEQLSLKEQIHRATYLANLVSEFAALVEFQDLLTQYPKDPSIQHVYGNFLYNFFRKSRLADAEKALRKAVELDPKSGYAHFDLGRVLEALGETKEADEEFEKAKKLPQRSAGHK